jgi:alkylation response protein AidB-like acyl-CoA dehydrogenase
MSDAFIYDHLRTPRGRGRPDGKLHEVPPIELLTQVLRQIRDRNDLPTERVDDVVMGCAREEIGIIKVVGARMLHDVIDRAIQVFGAMGLTDDTPLELMYRHARAARIYDGPDEVHVQSVAKRLLARYKQPGASVDFASMS